MATGARRRHGVRSLLGRCRSRKAVERQRTSESDVVDGRWRTKSERRRLNRTCGRSVLRAALVMSRLRVRRSAILAI